MNSDLQRVAGVLSDRYTVEREIGAGGMATVYLAVDRKHNRQVAIKVMHPGFAATLAAERFLREIEVAARLTHPHILPLHDSGRADGLLYYVMPYVGGRSLRDLMLREGPLPLPEVLRIAHQVSSALEHAHQQGFVHRDIKPENILLESGEAVVADFGLALAVSAAGDARMTHEGMVLGTPYYMSPEQARGDPRVDKRSDIYALACVVYEMLTGRPVFDGDTPESIVRRRLSESAPSARGVQESVPRYVDAALQKGLAQSPDDRFETPMEFVTALASGFSGGFALEGVPASVLTRSRTAQLVGVLLLALLVATGVWWTMFSGQGGTVSRPRLAVLPFENRGGVEDDYFAEGITDEITTRLATASGVSIVARQSARRFKDSDLTLRELGRELNAAYLLTGSVQWDRSTESADRVRVTPTLIRAEDETEVWSGSYEEPMEDVFGIQSAIAQRVTESLDVTLLTEERSSLGRAWTDNIDAYAAYLRGRHQWRLENWESAAQDFERAIALDSAFALAYSGLADALAPPYLTVPMPLDSTRNTRALWAARRGVELDSTRAETHASLGVALMYAQRDWEAAHASFQRSLRLDPEYALAHQFYAFNLNALGRVEEARRSARRARDLDPAAPATQIDYGYSFFLARDFERAAQEYRRAIELNPGFARAHANLGLIYLRQGRFDEAVEEFVQSGYPQSLAQALADGVADPALRDAGVAAFTELEEALANPPVILALAYATLGDKDKAFQWLDRVLEFGDLNIATLALSPFWDNIRDDPRFDAVLERARLL